METATKGRTVHLKFIWTVSSAEATAGYNICTLYANDKRVARCTGGGYDMEGTCLGSYIERAFSDRLLTLKEADMPKNYHWSPYRKPGRHCDNFVECEGKISPGKFDRCESAPCPNCGGATSADFQSGKTVYDGQYFYGLRFVDPKYDAWTAKLAQADGTFTDETDIGKTLGELQMAGKIVDLDFIRAHYAQTSPYATDRHTVPSINGGCGKSSVEKIAQAIGLKLSSMQSRSQRNKIYILHVSEVQA